MPRVKLGQTSVTHGEVTPFLGGRTDLEQLQASAALLENFRVLETGAFTRRPGTRFLRTTKFQGGAANQRAHLVPFVPANDQAYMLEFDEGVIRIHRADGTPVESSPGVPVEVATPYLETDIPAFRFAPDNDALYIDSAFYAPRVLERFSDTVWRLRLTSAGSQTGEVRPSFEYGTRPPAGATLTAGAVTGNGITFTAGAAVFLASDASPVGSFKGRELVVFDGPNTGAKAIIKTFVDSTHVTADIVYAWADLTAVAVTDWKISVSPLATCTPTLITPIHAETTLTLSVGGWRSSDEGKFVRINGGLYELGAPSSTTVINAVIRVLPLVAGAAQFGAWSLEELAWSAFNGFPAANGFDGPRLWHGGTFRQPDTLVGSKSNDFENYATGTLDDDAVQETLRSARANAIRWIVAGPGRKLLIGTSGDGFVLTGGGIEDVITPSNVQSTPTTSYGASETAAPIRVGNVVLFIDASGRRLIELVFDDLSKAYLDPDLLLLSSHLTAPSRRFGAVTPKPFIKIVLQRAPIRTIWALRADGILGILTYLREQNVVGWSRCITAGVVEDVDVIPKPDGTGERVWISVARTIAGANVRYLEWFDDDGLFYENLNVDSALTFDGLGKTTLTPAATTGADVIFAAGAPAFIASDATMGRQLWAGIGRATIIAFTDSTHVHAVIDVDFPSVATIAAGDWGIARTDLPGLGHLEGDPVWVVGDGAVQNTISTRPVVVGGIATATQPAVTLEVGMHYRSLFKSQKPVVQIGGSGTEGQLKGMPDILIRVVDSLNVLINGHRELERTAADPLDQAPALRSMDVIAGNLGISRTSQITIEQDLPLPLTVLMIQPTLAVVP